MRMRYACFVVIFLMVLGCREAAKEAIPGSRQGSGREESGAVAPLFQDLEGNAVALTEFKGKKVLLNYWATWCRPCIEEMPSLLRLQELLKTENYIFLLASDQSIKTIKDFKEARGFDFNFIKFSGSLTEQGISALPVTFIYNERGEQVERISGAVEWDAPEMILKLKSVK